MRRPRVLAFGVAGLAVVAAGLAIIWTRSPASLSFEVRDAASKSAVWDSTIGFQNRVIRGFSSTSYRFTHLRPGSFDLTVSAPHYEPARLRVRIRPGRLNTIAPISLVGYEIPDFSRLAVTAARGAGGLQLELNPVDAGGNLITRFPCIDLRIALRVSVQLKAGSPALAPSAEGAERGATLFEGKSEWTWNAAPDAVYRYRTVVAGVPDAAPYVLVDYVVLVPDPRRISSHEVDTLVNGLAQIRDARALALYLRPYSDKVKMESGTLWNIR